MEKPIAIDSDAKRAKLIELLELCIESDCVRGRELLAREKGPGGRAHELPPKLLATLEKNTDMREAAYRQIIEDLGKHHTGGSMNTESFFRQFVLSVTHAFRNEPDYASAFLDQVKATELPQEVQGHVGALAKQQGSKPILIKVSPGKIPSAEEIELMGYRAKTIDLMALNAFNAFYEAATGEEMKRGNPANPRYREYIQQVEHMLYGGDTHGASPA